LLKRGQRQQVVLSWSGGKDSALALDALLQDDRYEVVGLLTSITADFDRVSVHGVRRSMLLAQVERLGLPLFEIALPRECTNSVYETAFTSALDAIRRELPEAKYLAFGDLFLADVRSYRERLLAKTDFVPIFPIWGVDTHDAATLFVQSGYEAHLVCVDTTLLDPSFAGRRFDAQLLADLPSGIDPCGERGEFHTFVSSAPSFTSPVPFRIGERVLRDDRFMYCDVE
jgi:uncharacterized protein (TIGR00290 family)